MRTILVAALVVGHAAGCVQSASTVCGDNVCRQGSVCAPDGVSCVAQAQVDVCAGASDGAGCSYPGTSEGVCRDAACVPAGCGNGVQEPGELCDDGNRVSLDGCRSDCLTLEMCGDGAVEPVLGEGCDCGIAGSTPAICDGPNSVAPGATCRPDCRLARCGDGIIDPGESCDDGNLLWGDGCRADCLGRFQKMQSPTARNLRAVWTSGPTNAYAVGDYGTILRFDGTAWTAVDLGTISPGHLGLVWGSGPNDVYAASTIAANQTLHFNGTSWRRVDVGLGILTAIGGTSSNNVYAAGARLIGDPGLVHFSGTDWTLVNPHPCGAVTSISGTSSTNVLLSGSAICQRSGTTWPQVHGEGYDQVVAVSSTLAYALRPASPTFLRWTGTGAWTQAPQPPGSVTRMVSSGTEIVAVGDNGVVLSFDGMSWTSLVSTTEQKLTAVAGTDRSNMYIVGDNGTILH